MVALKVLIISFLYVPNIEYMYIRSTYLSDVLLSHTTHYLLYGKGDANDVDNETLFLNVQDFIIHSKRFD